MSTPSRRPTPSAPPRDADEIDRYQADRPTGRRFWSRRADAADAPVSPLVEQQRDSELQAAPLIRDRAVAAPPTAAGDWRSTVFGASGLNVVAGLWLLVAPFVLAYGDADPVWNDVVLGAAVAILATARVAGAHGAAWLSWTIVVIGAWVFASAFWLDGTATVAINDVVVGSLMAVLGATSAMATHDAERVGDPALHRH